MVMLLPKYVLCLYREERETVAFLGWKPMYSGEKEFKQRKVLNVQLWSWNSPQIQKGTISLVPFKIIMAPLWKQNKSISSI